MRKFLIRTLAVVLILVALGVGGFALFQGSSKANQQLVFADHTLLDGLWNNYKTTYWESGTGRTLDKQQNNITTSEGQSYTMMRAVWQSDQATFDKTWGWTQQQMQRPDKLFSWKWGQKSNGTYGVLTDQGGQNTASDADSDIAMALLMAAGRWQQQSYLDQARAVIQSMWANDVVTVNGTPYLAADNLEKDSSQPIVINPSYFAPYAYKAFAKVDTKDNWSGLVDSSYAVLNQVIDSPLNTSKSVGLPPNWVVMDKKTGQLSASSQSNLDTNYGYDAIRVQWRLALDYMWNKDDRAKSTLQKMSFINQQWSDNSKLASVYGHDGNVVSGNEAIEMYGTALAAFTVTDPAKADQVYDQKIKTLYDPNNNKWSMQLTYYADNWAWFGLAMYDNQLPNLVNQIHQ